MLTEIDKDKETELLIRNSSNGIIESYSLKFIQKSHHAHMDIYKLHTNLSAEDYERAETLLKHELHNYLKSRQN